MVSSNLSLTCHSSIIAKIQRIIDLFPLFGRKLYRAGTTDSALTNHGVLQIQRLAAYFRSEAVKFEHVFASDLSRAAITAEGICKTAPEKEMPVGQLMETPLLREQHFGSREGVRIHAAMTVSPSTVEPEPAETEVSMRTRANRFLEEYLFPVLLSYDDETEKESAIAIVAHGIILRVLWNCFIHAFPPESISFSPEVAVLSATRGGTLVPFWSNTGYMELSVRRRPTPISSAEVESLLSGWTVTVISVDNKAHLRDLRRTRGGIGSSQHDSKQRSIETFFKR